MTTPRNLFDLPDNLPVPHDDGACDHLTGLDLPDILLHSTEGRAVTLRELAQNPTVFFFYPRTGRPDEPAPLDWDLIPGARGCTPQSCGYRDLFSEYRAHGIQVFGASTQTSAYQQEFAKRVHLPFEILSDANFALTDALRLPTFEYGGMRLLKRMSWFCNRGKIEKVFYPVFPPDQNAENVLHWIHSTQHSILNFRPVRGIKRGRLFRSGDLSAIQPEDAKFLTAALGIRAYCDLRTDDELVRFGMPVHATQSGIEHVRVPATGLKHEIFTMPAPTSDDFARSYVAIAEISAGSIRRIIELISETDSATVVGCSAGKDRTGVVIAIALRCLGVDTEEIAHEYALSTAPLLKGIHHFEKFYSSLGMSAESFGERLICDPQIMLRFFAQIDAKYGSFADYLRAIDVTDGMVARLRSSFSCS